MNTFLQGRPLSTKLRVVVLSSTLVALVVALGAMIAYDLLTYHRAWVGDVQAQAELISHAGVGDLVGGDARGAHDTLTMLRFQPKVRSAAIYDVHGRLFASYRANEATALPPPTGDGSAADAEAQAAHDLVVRSPIVDRGQAIGTVYLRTRDELVDRFVTYAGLAAVVALLALGATWIVSSWLQSIVTRPIIAIAAVARDVVTQNDYSRRVDKPSDDEVGDLVDAFNGMLDELEVRVRTRTAQLEKANLELSAAMRDAESANRAKSEFLSNMSHELRTPLNAIIGFGQLMSVDDNKPSSAERNRGFVKHIVDAGHHLLTLINEILNLAQIEAGRLSISLEPVQLSEVLEECHALTRTASSQRGIRLLFPLETPLRVNADRTRLKQVLLNLLSNAVKYNRDDGAVIVECAEGDEGRVRISVQDTGDGLTPTDLKSLFQPFNRLGRDGSGIEGSGIGLVLTKRLVELMGGTIGVHSAPGTGSTFWLDLRGARSILAVAAPVVREAIPTLGPAVRATTILCVDDNRANLALLTEALSWRAECIVLTATDGEAGVAMARAHRPDVILMDNNMPVMSGREAMRVLRTDPATAAIPVICVSAAAMPDMVSSGLEQGYFQYLVKPYDLVDLTAAVDSALDSVKRRPA